MDRSFKSVTAGGEDSAQDVAEAWVPMALANFPVKFWWFASRPEPYTPHVWQYVFHAADQDGKLRRFRHLVAGRRGGKTLSAAWEILFYALFPDQFHYDAHRKESNRPLWIWALAKDYQAGRPSLRTFIEVCNAAGLVKDRDYKYNRAQQTFEFFDSGSLVEFKTANDPQSLRGAGLDILWIDEAAFIPNADAWEVVWSALGDKQGIVVTTTTPWGENWFYERFFDGTALDDQRQFRVEYTSIDNPYYPAEEWEYNKIHMHPVLFAQEHLASFKAMHGVSLSGEWLKYWVKGNPDTKTDDISVPREGDRLLLRVYIGVDPAVSLSDKADDFAMVAMGVHEDTGQAFLLEYFLGHIAFPDQLDKIHEWHLKWRPEMIGIEANAAQGWLPQQAQGLPNLPPVVPVFSKGQKQGKVSAKNSRILRMAPLFKIGKVRINREHSDFLSQWVSFDAEKVNQRDDLLDATEIALSLANVLMPMLPHVSHIEGPGTVDDDARARIREMKKSQELYDPELGDMA
jgi:phage terminase large subunit-like protein